MDSKQASISEPVIAVESNVDKTMFDYMQGKDSLEEIIAANTRARNISFAVDMPLEEAKALAQDIVALFQTSCCREHRIEWLAEQLLKLK